MQVVLPDRPQVKVIRTVSKEGRPYRVLYAFDPRRVGILLIGGDKTGDDRWYDRSVPRADEIYRTHLKEIEDE